MANIKVAIKMRPLIEREKRSGDTVHWFIDGNTIRQTDMTGVPRQESYTFDHVFGMESSNPDVFNTVVKPLVESVIGGINTTIFAYGQTSSGKTHTMMGSSSEPGVIHLTISSLLQAMEEFDGRQFLVRVSYMEIYNEKINDLLGGKKNLKVREEDGKSIVIDLKEEVVTTVDKVLSLMRKGEKYRRVGETNMNERSSRSHTIFRLVVESRETRTSIDMGCGNEDDIIQVSHLNLVDLAGSERSDHAGTKAGSERFREGCHINTSLFTLGFVIKQLSEGLGHVNFRDSKLTRILEPALGGNSLTAIICAVTPASIDETHCTLGFASRAKKIKNEPHVNEVLSDGTLLKRYARQLAKLQHELEKAKSEDVVEEMKSKLLEKEKLNELLQERIDRLKEQMIGAHYSHDRLAIEARRNTLRRKTWGGGGGGTHARLSTFTKLVPIAEFPSFPLNCSSQSIEEAVFQTPIEEFERELIESENVMQSLSDGQDFFPPSDFINTRRRVPSKGGSIGSIEESVYFTPRQRSSFTASDVFINTCDKSTETEPFFQTSNGPLADPDLCPEFVETPPYVLRSRYRDLEEFTTLEKQMYVEDSALVQELRKQIKDLRQENTLLKSQNAAFSHSPREFPAQNYTIKIDEHDENDSQHKGNEFQLGSVMNGHHEQLSTSDLREMSQQNRVLKIVSHDSSFQEDSKPLREELSTVENAYAEFQKSSSANESQFENIKSELLVKEMLIESTSMCEQDTGLDLQSNLKGLKHSDINVHNMEQESNKVEHQEQHKLELEIVDQEYTIHNIQEGGITLQRHLEELISQNTALQEELKKKTLALNKLQEQFELEEKEIVILKQKNDELNERLYAMEEMGTVHKLAREKESEILSLREQSSELVSVKENNIQLKDTLETKQQELDKLIDECSSLRIELGVFKDTNKTLQKNLEKNRMSDEMKKSFSETNELINRYESEIKSLKSVINDIQKESMISKRELQEFKDERIAFEEELQKKALITNSLQKQIAAKEEQLGILSEENNKLTEEINALKNSISEKESDVLFLKEKSAEQNCKLKSLMESNTQLKSMLETKQEKLITIDDLCASLRRELKEIKDSNYKLQQDLDLNLQMSQDLKKRLLKEINGLCTDSPVNLKSENYVELFDIFLNCIVQKEKEMVETLMERYDTSDNKDHLKKSWTKHLECEVERLQEEINKQKKENGELSCSMEAKKEIIEQFKREVFLLRKKLADTENDYACLQYEDGNVRKQLIDAEVKIHELSVKLSDITEDLKEKTNEIERCKLELQNEKMKCQVLSETTHGLKSNALISENQDIRQTLEKVSEENKVLTNSFRNMEEEYKREKENAFEKLQILNALKKKLIAIVETHPDSGIVKVFDIESVLAFISQKLNESFQQKQTRCQGLECSQHIATNILKQKTDLLEYNERLSRELDSLKHSYNELIKENHDLKQSLVKVNDGRYSLSDSIVKLNPINTNKTYVDCMSSSQSFRSTTTQTTGNWNYEELYEEKKQLEIEAVQRRCKIAKLQDEVDTLTKIIEERDISISSSKDKINELKVELRRIQHSLMKNTEITSDKKCCDVETQTEDVKMFIRSGSGVITRSLVDGLRDQVIKLEKHKEILKSCCQSNQERVKWLEGKICEITSENKHFKDKRIQTNHLEKKSVADKSEQVEELSLFADGDPNAMAVARVERLNMRLTSVMKENDRLNRIIDSQRDEMRKLRMHGPSSSSRLGSFGFGDETVNIIDDDHLGNPTPRSQLFPHSSNSVGEELPRWSSATMRSRLFPHSNFSNSNEASHGGSQTLRSWLFPHSNRNADGTRNEN